MYSGVLVPVHVALGNPSNPVPYPNFLLRFSEN